MFIGPKTADRMQLRQAVLSSDEQFRVVFEAIRQLLAEEEKPKKKIGF